MAKCKLLLEENAELGKKLSENEFHKLQHQLAIQKQISSELRLKMKGLE
jgi:hypothetical protein